MRESDKILREIPQEGLFGLEQEGLRVDASGRMAQTRNPFHDDPHIDRDFCENQVEFGTDIYPSIDALVDGVGALRGKIAQTLLHLPTGPEYIWPFSSPPAMESDAEIPIAHFDDPNHRMLLYRQYLARKYGKWVMTYSGIHFNFSFPDHFLKTFCGIKKAPDYRAFVNRLYMDLAESLVQHTWLIVYLTAASSVIDPSTRVCDPAHRLDYASPRCSEIGYWNPFTPELDFSSIGAYAASITKYIEEGLLFAGSELYYPIRVKPRGKYNLVNLCLRGISHVELRMLDLNPLSPYGIEPRDLKFIYYLILYLATQGRTHDLAATEQAEAIQNMKNAARYDDTAVSISVGGALHPLRELTLRILDDMHRAFWFDPAAQRIIEFQREKVTDPSKRYAVRIRETYQEDFIKKGMELAVSRANVPFESTCASYSRPFQNKNIG